MKRPDISPPSRPARRLGCMALAVVLVGCTPATEILVVVDSDLDPATELPMVEVSVTAGGGTETRRFDIAESGLPFSLSVAPAEGSGGDVVVRATGLDSEEQTVVARSANLAFVSGRAIRLDIPLARACAFQEELCGEGDETCDDGACIDDTVDESELPDAPSGAPSRLFDGPSMPADAGPDAGVEGDAGGCVEGAPCSPMRTCRTGTMQCGEAPRCEVTGMMPPGTSCGEGRSCSDEGLCGR